MATTKKIVPATTIDDYIAGYPKDIRAKLERLRKTIKKAAPKAGETIKYAIPTFTFHGNLVSFAAYKNHIGFYPAPLDVEEFKEQLAKYAAVKSTARFPLNEPLPIGLINKMVKYLVKRKQEKENLKVKKTK